MHFFRAGLVFCDPVLSCITVTPQLLLNYLPGLVEEYACLRHSPTWNLTLSCVLNHSDITNKQWYIDHEASSDTLRIAMLADKVSSGNTLIPHFSSILGRAG